MPPFLPKSPPGELQGRIVVGFGPPWGSPRSCPDRLKSSFLVLGATRGDPRVEGRPPATKEHQNSCRNCGYVPFQRTVFVRFVAAFFVPCLAPKFQKRSVLNVLGGPLKYRLRAQCQAIASESSRLLWIVGSITLRAFRYLLIQVYSGKLWLVQTLEVYWEKLPAGVYRGRESEGGGGGPRGI